MHKAYCRNMSVNSNTFQTGNCELISDAAINGSEGRNSIMNLVDGYLGGDVDIITIPSKRRKKQSLF